MTDITKSIILGIIEGLTEFIPVSSTGHLILFGEWLDFNHGNEATFDVAIQLGAIMAVVILYRRFFLEFLSFRKWLSRDMLNILLAIMPAFVLGFLLYDFIKTLFSPALVIAALFVGGLIMIVVDRFLPQNHHTTSFSEIHPKQALIVGLCQCFALWPGMSRSASTIVGGLLAKMDYATSAKFSFIIAVPVMMAAVAYDLLKNFHALTAYDLKLIAIGFIVSFIVALGAIVTFLKLLQKFKLLPFAVYRIALAAIVFVILLNQ